MTTVIWMLGVAILLLAFVLIAFVLMLPDARRHPPADYYRPLPPPTARPPGPRALPPGEEGHHQFASALHELTGMYRQECERRLGG